MHYCYSFSSMDNDSRLTRRTWWRAYWRARWRIYWILLAQWLGLVAFRLDFLAEHLQTVVARVIHLCSHKQSCTIKSENIKTTKAKVKQYSSLYQIHCTIMRTCMTYGITQSYLPPGRDSISCPYPGQYSIYPLRRDVGNSCIFTPQLQGNKTWFLAFLSSEQHSNGSHWLAKYDFLLVF